MAPASTPLPARPASRRAVLQVMLALPAFALFQSETVPASKPKADGIVEINGWILKRSDVA